MVRLSDLRFCFKGKCKRELVNGIFKEVCRFHVAVR